MLGPRLRECAEPCSASTADAAAVLGEVDAMKLRSSMTLFARADPPTRSHACSRSSSAAQVDPVTDRLLG